MDPCGSAAITAIELMEPAWRKKSRRPKDLLFFNGFSREIWVRIVAHETNPDARYRTRLQAKLSKRL
jgi:hypothetical protein